MEELIVWVNEQDEEIGYGEKMDTHVSEQLHRAFSLFIYNKHNSSYLLHKRAYGKYHSGGLWTNTCCSHPRKGENLHDAVVRRTQEELGITIVDSKKIKELGKFQYYHKFENCAEHEIDHVFLYIIDQEKLKTNINKDEIAEIKWINRNNLSMWMKENPEDFTAWFFDAYKMVEKYMSTLGK